MNRGIFRNSIYVFTFALLLISSTSYAACKQEDIAGLWQFFIVGGGVYDPAPTVFVEISSAGEIIGGAMDYVGSRYEFDSGKVVVKNRCRIKGSIQIGGNVVFTLIDSRTRPDTQYWVGFVDFKDGHYEENITNFTAVRVR